MSYIVHHINEQKGSGVFATSKIMKNDTIFEEDPFVSCQFSWNKAYNYLACNYCMKSLETAQEMYRRLSADPNLVLPFPNKAPQPIAIIKCERCDQAVYCSYECREKADQSYHQILCRANDHVSYKGLEDLDELWRNFHYPPETSTINIIVRIMAMYKQAVNKEEFEKILNGFCRKSRNEHSSISHRLLGEEFAEKISVLREQVACLVGDEGMCGWLNLDGFTHMFALLGTNQQGVGSSSISCWYHNLTDDEQQHPSVQYVYDRMEAEAGGFLDCEGVGLYALQSKCNHSCKPNAEVRFDHGNHRLTLKALDNIEAGDEICISYLGRCVLERSRHSRQKVLRENYLFHCTCEKCVEQAVDPDLTSESEDETDDEMMYSDDESAMAMN